MSVLYANFTSSALTVLLLACSLAFTAMIAISEAIASTTERSSAADSSLTRWAPDFLSILYMADSASSGESMRSAGRDR